MKSAFHPEAREEFLAAIDLYNQTEPGLGLDFAGEIKRFDTYLQLKEMNPAELEKRLEKAFKDSVEAMNSRKKGKFSVEGPVFMNFSY